MNMDIGPVLEGWEFKPNEISVRKIIGYDGKEKIQLRLDLGLLQMETQGRPDGKRPYGMESLLEYYRSLLEEHEQKYGSDENFVLDGDDCTRLQQEAVQYYHRYLSLLQIEDYEGVQRDTDRNLRVLDLVLQYAADEKDKWSFEQYRPYITMINARAKVSLRLAKKDFDEALTIIDEAIEIIENFFKKYDREDLIEGCAEIQFLRDWGERIRQDRPVSEKERLQRELQAAVEAENYERAAYLRDRLKVIS